VREGIWARLGALGVRGDMPAPSGAAPHRGEARMVGAPGARVPVPVAPTETRLIAVEGPAP
jgi:hypothetical protein